MRNIDFDGKRFRAQQNSSSGEVSGGTLFVYHQEGDLVRGTYSGGEIRFGTLLAKVATDGSLDMRYQHLNQRGELMTGICESRLEILPDGRYRLHEQWQWTCGSRDHGTSILDEVPATEA